MRKGERCDEDADGEVAGAAAPWPPETQKRKKKATEERREGLMRGLEGGGLEREREMSGERE